MGSKINSLMVINAQDYYPFGMVEPGRQYAILGDSSYRFAFNGKLHDDDIYGKDNSYNYDMRFYDPRLGRFLSIDPAASKYPFISPYSFAADNPIRYTDILGLGADDRIKYAQALVDKGYKYKQEFTQELRTGSDPKDLEYMDCAEFVCRVIAADKITSGVKWMACGPLMAFFADKSKFDEHAEPQAGDIGIWSEHTFIVKSYDAAKKEVTVLHATQYTVTKRDKNGKPLKDKNGKPITMLVSGTKEETYSLSYYQKQDHGKGAHFYAPKTDKKGTTDVSKTATTGTANTSLK